MLSNGVGIIALGLAGGLRGVFGSNAVEDEVLNVFAKLVLLDVHFGKAVAHVWHVHALQAQQHHLGGFVDVLY